MNGALLLKALDRTFALGLSQTQRDALERAHANAFALVRNEVILAAGADRVSEELERLGIRMAIVTSGSHDDAQIYCDRLKLTPSTLCITREDEARSKPSSNQLHRAFKQLRVDPRDAALVGDRNRYRIGVGRLTPATVRPAVAVTTVMPMACAPGAGVTNIGTVHPCVAAITPSVASGDPNVATYANTASGESAKLRATIAEIRKLLSNFAILSLISC
jgi:hypothetical protein